MRRARNPGLLADTMERCFRDMRGTQRNPRGRRPSVKAAIECTMIFNEVCADLKGSGARMSDWDEDEWRQAMADAGIPEDMHCDLLESAASWGVDD